MNLFLTVSHECSFICYTGKPGGTYTAVKISGIIRVHIHVSSSMKQTQQYFDLNPSVNTLTCSLEQH